MNQQSAELDKNIEIRKNNKLNNVISNKIEHFNKYDKKGVYKLTCTNYNTFFNMRPVSKQHRK